ncbi:hypothetical protein HID58_014739, partial [Brassica napus]
KEICLKKKHIDRSSEDEYNIGWSWLERWKATRVPETSFRLRLKQNIQGDEMFKAWSFNMTGELESNDLPLQFESISETLEEET